MADLLIKNARVIDPSQGLDEVRDILISNGRISAVEPIDAEGLVAAPGFVDMHVHLRDPGFTHKEDIITGSAAAAAGGVTTVVAMPNTKPVADCEQVFAQITEKAKNAKAHIRQVGAISKGQLGEELTDFEKLKQCGAVALSDDGVPVATAKLMYDALKKANELKIPVLAHCEEKTLSGKGIINCGAVSEKIGVEGIPNAAEDAGTAREICLADGTASPVHICHVSTAQSVKMIACAKAAGVGVTAETCPHYFIFTDEKVLGRDADYRMNPPLRSEGDRLAIIEGIKSGAIDVISTDHAPHTVEEKADFTTAMNGVIGMETSFSASKTYLVDSGIISLPKLIEMMSTRPAQILGIEAGSLKVGSVADVVIFDPDEKWTVDVNKLHGKSKNAVFKGMELNSKVKYTVCGGEKVYDYSRD